MKKHSRFGRNFDDLAPKFSKKVYGSIKGRVRLAVLKNDLARFFPCAVRPVDDTRTPLHILDAGSGYGPFSLKLAELGHCITLCDISAKMLEKADRDIMQKNISSRVQIFHKAIQELSKDGSGPYDLILCHAVLDWVDEPEELMSHLNTLLSTNGVLSLTFYNLHGMIFKNLLRTNYKKILKKEYTGWPGSLTPQHPRKPDEVKGWIKNQNLEIICHSGIRVFHDYILNPDDRDKAPDTVLDLELEFSRKPPYRDLGRYQHILARKNAD